MSGAVLDLERGGQPQYQLVIHAVDRGQPRKTGSAQVTITVEDINDSPPQFEPGSYVEYVPENAQVSTQAEATRLLRKRWRTGVVLTTADEIQHGSGTGVLFVLC